MPQRTFNVIHVLLQVKEKFVQNVAFRTAESAPAVLGAWLSAGNIGARGAAMRFGKKPSSTSAVIMLISRKHRNLLRNVLQFPHIARPRIINEQLLCACVQLHGLRAVLL